jgi:hypothetical protein
MNYSTLTANNPISDKKISFINPSSKNSLIESMSSAKNKTIEFKVREADLKIIT